MQHDVKESDKRDVGLSEINVFTTTTERSDRKRLTTASVFINEQGNDQYCSQVSFTLQFAGLMYNYDRNGFLTQKSPMDRAVQKVVLTLLRARLLYQSHFLTPSGHPGERCMYNKIRREYCWLPTANHLYMTVRDCRNCFWKCRLTFADAQYSYIRQVTRCKSQRQTSWDHCRRLQADTRLYQ